MNRRDDGTLEAIFRALSADADMENLSLDSTCIKVHESANFMLSAGNGHDSVHAVELLKRVEISGSNVLADRAYGATAIRAYSSEQEACYVIPPQGNVSEPWTEDWRLYKAPFG